MPAKTKSPSVFVGGIGLTVTDAQLAEFFAAVAPVQRAFVVRDAHRASKGCGFVSL
jgi:RNA recognition motif-containing protein